MYMQYIQHSYQEPQSWVRNAAWELFATRVHTHTHTYIQKKKIHPLFSAPCPSRQPLLQMQLLFSLQTTCYLGHQLCLFVKQNQPFVSPLGQRTSFPVHVTG